MIERRRRIKASGGELFASPTRAYPANGGGPRERRASLVLGAKDGAIRPSRFDDRLVFKLFRRVEEGVNPISKWGACSSRNGTVRWPSLRWARIPRRPQRARDPWHLAQLRPAPRRRAAIYGRRAEALLRARGHQANWGAIPPPKRVVDLLGENEPGPAITDMIGAYLDAARLLGVRTGELHVALSSGPERQDFHARTLLDLVPALDVPIDAQRRRSRDASPQSRAPHAAPRRPRDRRRVGREAAAYGQNLSTRF